MKPIINEIKFFQHHESPYDLIVWSWAWQGRKIYSQALNELIETNYNLN